MQIPIEHHSTTRRAMEGAASWIEALARVGISARRGIMAAHRQLPYRELTPEQGLPETERLNDRTLILPVFHQLTEADQGRVIAVLRDPDGAES